MRKRVEEMRSCQMSQEQIAKALGITRPTLEKHFKEEISIGAAVRRAEVIGLLYKQARKGNIAAIKHLEQMTKVQIAVEAADERANGGEAPAAAVASTRMQKTGKKEQRLESAQAAAVGRFAPPPPPKLKVVGGADVISEEGDGG